MQQAHKSESLVKEWYDCASSTDLLNYWVWGVSKLALPVYWASHDLILRYQGMPEYTNVTLTGTFMAASYLVNSYARNSLKQKKSLESIRTNRLSVLESSASDAVKILAIEGLEYQRDQVKKMPKLCLRTNPIIEWKKQREKRKSECFRSVLTQRPKSGHRPLLQ